MKKGKVLREGVSTGACAAAAAKAAVMALWGGAKPERVIIENLQGEAIEVIINEAFCNGKTAWASVIKDAGDDPDVTNGLTIKSSIKIESYCANDKIEMQKTAQVFIDGGQGVGRITKPGLALPVGEAAINPVPCEMIRRAILDAAHEMNTYFKEAKVTVEVPGGEEVAKKTLNPKLGIIGGISILGTTGKVKPMSEEAWKRSLPPQVSIARAAGYEIICLTPGRMGEKWATEKYGIPADAVVQMSNFVGFMLNTCVEQGIKKVLLFGHHGKITKVAAGNWHTHSKVADGRLETIAAFTALNGADLGLVRNVLEANTAEAVLELLDGDLREKVYRDIAARAARRAEDYVFGQMEVGCVMLDLKGEILGFDHKAVLMGEEAHWKLGKSMS